jgi:hypothetical protein
MQIHDPTYLLLKEEPVVTNLRGGFVDRLVHVIILYVLMCAEGWVEITAPYKDEYYGHMLRKFNPFLVEASWDFDVVVKTFWILRLAFHHVWYNNETLIYLVHKTLL